jgi:hypothetical protein
MTNAPSSALLYQAIGGIAKALPVALRHSIF